MVFPDHPEWLDEEVVDWRGEEDVAAAVETFLGRVSALFPVHEDFWDADIEVVEWRLWEIPVIPYGYDVYYDDWMDLKEPAAYLLHMIHSRYDEDSHSGRGDFSALYPDHQAPRYLEPHRLVESLRQVWAERMNNGEQAPSSADRQPLPEPLSALPDLIAMLEQTTGNAWMDVGELSLAEGGGYPVWSRENVEWLAAEWEKAKPVLDGVHRLLDWQNETKEEIHEKLTAVRDALLEAYNRTNKESEQTEPEVTS